MSRSYRWGPLAGVASIVLIVVAFMVAGSSPNTNGDTSKIVTFLAKNSNFNRNVAALFIALAGLMLLVVFWTVVRSWLVTDARFANHGALASVTGTVSAVFLFMALAGFTAPLFAAHDARPEAVDPNFYRLMNDFGYLFWVAAAGFAAIALWATSAAVLAGAGLPKWFGWVGIVLGVLLLGAVAFFPMFGYGIWVLIASILLAMRGTTSAAAAAP